MITSKKDPVPRSKNYGFTLIEMMICVALISIIAGICVSNVAIARDKAKIVACAANIKTVLTAIDLYANKSLA